MTWGRKATGLEKDSRAAEEAEEELYPVFGEKMGFFILYVKGGEMTSIKLRPFIACQIFLHFFLCAVLVVNAQAGQNGKGFLSVLGKDTGKQTGNPLKVTLSEAPAGIKVDILYFNKADAQLVEKMKFPPHHKIPEGGEITLYLDGQLVSQEPFSGKELKLSKTLESMMVGNGDHTLRCEINSFPGGQQKKEVSFHLDATPIIDVQTLESTKVFDPVFTFKLFGAMEGNAGFVEVYIDEQPAANFSVTTKDVSKAKKLSEILGKAAETNVLSQGTHLVRVAATAINGSKAVKYLSFIVDAKPDVSVSMDKEKKFSGLSVTFPPVSLGYFGNVDVYFNEGVIFASQAKEAHYSLTRADIEKAFKEHHHAISQYPVDLVIAVRAANSTEHWQRVEYR